MAAVARHHAIDAFVNMSQMSVSEMDVWESARSPQHRQHWLAEQVLQWSGLPVVTIRPTAFMDAFFWRFAVPTFTTRDALMLPFGEGKTSPIAAYDVARRVVAVLADPTPHLSKVYELTGPTAETPDAIAKHFSDVLGRPIAYLDVPMEIWLQNLRSFGAPEHAVAHLEVMASMHRGGLYDRSSNDVELLPGAAPMSIRDFVRTHRNDFSETGLRDAGIDEQSGDDWNTPRTCLQKTNRKSHGQHPFSLGFVSLYRAWTGHALGAYRCV